MRKLRGWVARFGGLFNTQRKDREFEEEIESHVQMHVEDNLRLGLTPEEARRQAIIKLGGVESVKEHYRRQRGLPLLEIFWQDIRYGVRMLLKNPGFSIVAVGTLALGIGVNTAIFSFLNSVVLQPLRYPNAERIVAIETVRSDLGRSGAGMAGADFLDFQTQSSVFETMAHIRGEDDLATVVGERAGFSNARSVSSQFFAVFGQRAAAGRLFAGADVPSTGPPTMAVVSHGWAVTHFGSPEAAVGKRISVYRTSLEIVGVAARGFRFPDSTDIWAPDRPPNAANRGGQTFQVVGRLREGVNLATAKAELHTIATRLAEQHEENRRKTVQLIPLQDKLTGNVRATLWALMAAVSLVLLIACANVSGLLIARSAKRSREIALRSALGAGRGRLVWQLLAESVVLALFGSLVGLAMAFLLVKAAVAWSPANLPRLDEIRIDRMALLFAIGLSFASTLICGLLPSVSALRFDLADSLKQGGSKGAASAGSVRLRFALVTAEVALSCMLLTGAGLFLRSFQALHKVDLGFSQERVLAAYTQYPTGGGRNVRSRIAFYGDLLNRVRALPGVGAACGAAMLPLGREPRPPGEYAIEGRSEESPEGRIAAQFQAITPGFLTTMRIPLLAGRDILDSDAADTPPVALVNESFARAAFPTQSPLGSRIKIGPPPGMEIVGVVADTRWWDPSQPSRPEIFAASAQGQGGSLSILVRTTSDPDSVVRSLRAVIHEADPTIPVRFETLRELFAEALAYPRFRAQSLSAFAGGAILLAAIGLYGLLAYTVNQRVREIGIRLALGAQQQDVLGLVIREGVRPALFGIAFGLTGAFACSQLLERLLYGIAPLDAVTFASVAGILIVVAFLACWLPARRAAKVDPMVALRYE